MKKALAISFVTLVTITGCAGVHPKTAEALMKCGVDMETTPCWPVAGGYMYCLFNEEQWAAVNAE